MEEERRIVVSSEELREIEARYTPIPAFAEWILEPPNLGAWNRRVGELQQIRQTAEPALVERSLRIATRAAAFDTGALEQLYPVDRGLTITVATEEPAWSDRVRNESGQDALALFEAQVEGYELVREVVDGVYPINEAWIRRLHEVLTAPQETYDVWLPDGTTEPRPLSRGAYKTEPNHVRLRDNSIHAYAPVRETPIEMERLVEQLHEPDFLAAHPVIQAAYAHYCLVAIHPFSDGNGRVARALASGFTFRVAGVPLLLFADERDEYLDALELADKGEKAAFVRLVHDAVLSAIGVVADELRAATAPAPAAVIGDLRRLLTAHGELLHPQIDQIAAGLVVALRNELTAVIGEHEFLQGVGASANSVGGSIATSPDGYRRMMSPTYVHFQAVSAPPAEAKRDVDFEVFIALDRDELELFWLRSAEADHGARFLLREVYPDISTSARLRLRALARETLGTVLAQLADQARDSFAQSGYNG
jgi:Fic family protein